MVLNLIQFSSVHFSCSVMSDSLWSHESQHARPPCLSIMNSWRSLRLTSIESVMPSSHLILCCPLLLLPSIPPSIRVFSNESALRMRWSKYWSFSLSIIPSKEIPELISFRIWLGHLFAPWFQASHLISLGIDFLTYEMELTIWQSCNIIAAIKWHK